MFSSSQETIDAQNELKNLKEELVAHLRDKSDVSWTFFIKQSMESN